MNKNILTSLLCAVFASACIVNSGAGSETTSAGTPASNAANTAAPTRDGGTAKTAAPVENAGSDAATKNASASDNPNAEDEQIRFARGATETTLERTIAPGVNKMYSFNAKKGQIVWFKVTEKTNRLAVDFNKNPVSIGEEVRQSLNASGDWAIYVSNPTDETLTYTLWIGIE